MVRRQRRSVTPSAVLRPDPGQGGGGGRGPGRIGPGPGDRPDDGDSGDDGGGGGGFPGGPGGIGGDPPDDGGGGITDPPRFGPDPPGIGGPTPGPIIGPPTPITPPPTDPPDDGDDGGDDGSGSDPDPGFERSKVSAVSCSLSDERVQPTGDSRVSVEVRNLNSVPAAVSVGVTADGTTVGSGGGQIPPQSTGVVTVNITMPRSAGTYTIESVVTTATESVEGL